MTDYLRFNLHGILCVAAGVVNLVVGLIILSKDPRSPLHRAFFYVIFAAFIWMFGWGMVSIVEHLEDAYFWNAFSYLGSPFISPSVYLFSSCWRKLPNHSFRIRVGYWLAFLTCVPLAFANRSFVVIHEKPWGRHDAFHDETWVRVFFFCILLMFFVYGFMAFYNFYKGWRSARSSRERAQFRNVFLAFIIAYTGSVDWFVSVGIDVYPFGYVSLTVLQLFVAYTLVRHQLLEVNLFLKRATLIVLIYSFLGLVIIPLVKPALEAAVGQSAHNPIHVVLLLSFLIGCAFSLGPIIYAYLVKHSYWLRGYQAAGLTHELKSPLGSIQGALEVIGEELEQATVSKKRLKEYVQMIRRNSSRMEEYVKSLLVVAGTEGAEMLVNKSETDLAEIVDLVIQDLRPMAKRKGISLRKKMAGACVTEVDADKIRLVFSNLVRNAIQFSERGTVTISINQGKREWVCAVEDQGRGIAPAHLERIFDRFFQAGGGSKGSGIGLTVAKAWVEAHGGKIWAESDGEGKGTRVTFTVAG